MNLEAQGRRIVIADNDRTVLELLQIRLDLAGYHTFVERTGPAALDTIRKMRPAAAIIDLHLPDMDGLSVLRALNPRGEGINFPVLVTARRLSAEDIQRSIAAGARDCMTKPFSGADLLERTARMFRRLAPAALQAADLV